MIKKKLRISHHRWTHPVSSIKDEVHCTVKKMLPDASQDSSVKDFISVLPIVPESFGLEDSMNKKLSDTIIQDSDCVKHSQGILPEADDAEPNMVVVTLQESCTALCTKGTSSSTVETFSSALRCLDTPETAQNLSNGQPAENTLDYSGTWKTLQQSVNEESFVSCLTDAGQDSVFLAITPGTWQDSVNAQPIKVFDTAQDSTVGVLVSEMLPSMKHDTDSALEMIVDAKPELNIKSVATVCSESLESNLKNSEGDGFQDSNMKLEGGVSGGHENSNFVDVSKEILLDIRDSHHEESVMVVNLVQDSASLNSLDSLPDLNIFNSLQKMSLDSLQVSLDVRSVEEISVDSLDDCNNGEVVRTMSLDSLEETNFPVSSIKPVFNVLYVSSTLESYKKQLADVNALQVAEVREPVDKKLLDSPLHSVVLVPSAEKREETRSLLSDVSPIQGTSSPFCPILQEWLLTYQMSAAANQNSSGPKTPTGISRHKSERERKIGHRRVGVGGKITYKKIQTSQIMGSIQLGIQHAVGGLASKPERDLLMQDFMTVETTNFPSEGSNHTPAHHYSEFRFRTYAPIAFRYFRDLFRIQPDDFLISMCSAPMRELSNPGASGSIFYLTEDDEFIVKTVQHKEGEFLQKLLPGYYMNLNQNPRTLLPKFFGLFCYQCNSKNVRLAVMNNLLPSSVKLHQKYDLKGSTYKRKASKSERQKNSPTYKDLDFIDHHPEGIGLEGDTYSALVKTIQRDCRVLESFKIMDYSLLVGIHNLDQAAREKAERRSAMGSTRRLDTADSTEEEGGVPVPTEGERERGATALNRSRSINRQRLVAHSTAMESIQAESEPIDEEEDVPRGGIPARNSRGERLLLFVGVIDILQSYRLKKKLEHTWKAMIHDGDTVSVHRPGFYAQRFQDFMAKTVFKKIPSPLKHSPSKRKSISRPVRTLEMEASDGGGFVSGHSPLPCSSTPPPAFEDALRGDLIVETAPVRHRLGPVHATSHHVAARNYREVSETVSISDVRLESRTDNKSSLSVESSSSTSGFGSGPTGRNLTWTPPASVEGSTPTWTEGTPSFTESSSSGDIGCPTTPMRSLNLRCNSEGPKSASNEGSLDCLDSEMVS